MSCKSIKDISIIGHNVHSIKNRIGDIVHQNSMYKANIILLQETWLEERNALNINNMTIMRKDRHAGAGGVALGLVNDIKYEIIEFNLSNKEIEIVGAKLSFLDGSKLDVASIYIPPNCRLTLRDIHQVINHVKRPFVIGGDWNAKSREWGCDDENAKGKVVMDGCDELRMNVINDGTPTHPQKPPRKSSVIDLMIASDDIALNLNFKVIPNSCGSDHLPFYVNNIQRLQNNSERCSVVTSVSIKKFKVLISNEEIQERFQINENSKHDSFMKYLNYVLDQSEVSINKNNNQVKKVWWDQNCSEMVANVIKKTRIFQRLGSSEAYEEMKLAERSSKKVNKEARKKSWRKMCSEMTRETAIADVWKLAKHFNGEKGATNIRINDMNLLEKFVDKNSPPDNQETLNFEEFISAESTIIPITLREMKIRIDGLKKSACGMDRISAKIIKELPLTHVTILKNIFNEIIQSKKVPKEFLMCKVVAIKKPRKPANEHTSFRPIAIFSTVRRLFDSLFLKRLEWWAEGNRILSPSQYGFRKGKSTRDCIAILVLKIKEAFHKKQVVLAAFLDISNAYGEVHLPGLLKNMDKQALPLNYSQLIWNLMKEKKTHYMLKDEVAFIRETRGGLSQGLPLSPILFNLDTSDVDEVLENGVEILQFADDQVFICAERNIEVAQQKVQKTLNNLKLWVSKKGFNFSAEKSEIVLFSRKHRDFHVHLEMNNVRLKQSECFRYLGISLDRKLCMKAHVRTVVESCNKAMNCLRSVAGKNWGMDPNTMLMLYKGLIRSKMEYCAFVYDLKCTHTKKLEKLQWRAIRFCSAFLQSTHTQSLEVLTGVPPIRERC